MNRAARLVVLLAAVGFSVVTAAQAAEEPKMDCKSDKKCDESEKAKSATKN